MPRVLSVPDEDGRGAFDAPLLPLGELKRSNPFDAGVCVRVPAPAFEEELGRSLKPLPRALLGKVEFEPLLAGRFASSLPRAAPLLAPNEEVERPAAESLAEVPALTGEKWPSR